MKRRCVIFLAALMIMIGCIGQSPDLEFTSGECDETIDTEQDMGIKEIKWIDDTTAVITVYVNINCAEEIKGGGYQIIGDKIILEYTSPQCKECVFCLCAHKLIYRFEDLEKKDYKFELKRIT